MRFSSLGKRWSLVALVASVLVAGDAFGQRGERGGRGGGGDGGGRSVSRGGGGGDRGGGGGRSFSRGGGGGQARSFSRGSSGRGGGEARSFSRGSSARSGGEARSFSRGGAQARSFSRGPSSAGRSVREGMRPSSRGSFETGQSARRSLDPGPSGRSFSRGDFDRGPSSRRSLDTGASRRAFSQDATRSIERGARPPFRGREYQAARPTEQQVRDFLGQDGRQRQARDLSDRAGGRQFDRDRGRLGDRGQTDLTRRLREGDRDGRDLTRRLGDADREGGDFRRRLGERDGRDIADRERDRDGRDFVRGDRRDRDFDRDRDFARRDRDRDFDRDGRDFDRRGDHRDWSGRRRDRDDFAGRVRDRWDDRWRGRWRDRDWDWDDFPFYVGWWSGLNWYGGPGWNHWGYYARRNPWYWWTWAPAPRLYGWFDYGWSTPYYWDYGPGEYIYYDDGVIYVNNEWYQPAPVFYERTVELVESAPDLTEQEAAQQEWLPLGVFAVTPEGQADIEVLVQLAVTQDGIIGGTAFDQSSDAAFAIEGIVEKETQRAVWSYTNASNQRVVMETSIFNLTQPEATGLTHRGPNSIQVVELVRLEPPEQASVTADTAAELPVPPR